MVVNAVSAPRFAPVYARDGAAVAAGGPVAAPAPAYASPTSTAPTYAAQQGDGMATFSTFLSQAFGALSAMFSKLVNWVKGLFGGTNVTGEVLTPEEAAIATQYKLQATKANVAAFRSEVSTYQSNGTLGPGVTNPDAVNQLQMALARLGYQVPATGQYDAATAQAVIKFKMDNGLHQTYRSADGNWAVNEYATPDVVAALIEKLRKALGQ